MVLRRPPHSRNRNTRQNFSCYGAFPIPDLINIVHKTPFSEKLLCPWHGLAFQNRAFESSVGGDKDVKAEIWGLSRWLGPRRKLERTVERPRGGQ